MPEVNLAFGVEAVVKWARAGEIKMEILLKFELHKAIEKWGNNIAYKKQDQSYFTDELINNMVKAAELVYDQNLETQSWLKEQGYFKDC